MLKFSGLSPRQIAASVGSALSTVQGCLRRAVAAGLGWPLPPELDDAQLEALLYPSKPRIEAIPLPDFAHVQRGTTARDQRTKGDRFILFDFDNAGVLTSHWVRLHGLNLRFQVRYVGGIYESRAVTEIGVKPDFPPLHGRYRRIAEDDIPAILARNEVEMAKAKAHVARLIEEEKQRENERINEQNRIAAAQRAAMDTYSASSSSAYSPPGCTTIPIARATPDYARGDVDVAPPIPSCDSTPATPIARATPEYDRSTYDTRYDTSSRSPDIVGTFQQAFSEAMGQSDAREAEAMAGIREAIRQGEAVRRAEEERQRREADAAIERDRAMAAERQAQYEVELAAQRQREAANRQVQEAARLEEARRLEQGTDRFIAGEQSTHCRGDSARFARGFLDKIQLLVRG